MNKGFVLNNFINIDSELERIFYTSKLRSRILGLFLLVFNDNGSELVFSKKMVRRAGFDFDEDLVAYKTEHFKVPVETKRVSDRIDVHFSWSEQFYQCNLRLHQNDDLQAPYIAELILLVDQPIPIASLEEEKQLWHSLEYLFFYVQMLIMSYEKIYLMIDVYTELLIAKVHYLPHHLTNVANWCILLSHELRLSSMDQIALYFAALVHDIGILFVPDEVVGKPTKLLPEEFDLIKMHPVRGAQIAEASLYGIPYFNAIPEIIKHHHENYNGSGYPDNLEGSAIPYLSRILNVADSVDAMLSHRIYRHAMTTDEVIRELEKKAGILFDPNIALIMIKIMSAHKFMPSEALVDADFIPHASLSFYYKDIKNVKAFTGNMIVSKQKGKFILHEAEESLHDMASKDIHKCTISFFKQNEFIEFSASVYGVLENKFFLTDFVYLPSDKYFSLVWKAETMLSIDSTALVNVKMIKLGGNSVVLETAPDVGEIIIGAPLGSLKMAFKETISELELDTLIHLRIVRYYKTGMSVIFNCSFYDLAPATCDLILKMLFRRQIEMKLNRAQSKVT